MKLRRVAQGDREAYLTLAKAFYHSPAVIKPVPEAYLAATFAEMMRSDDYVDGFMLESDAGESMGYALTAKTFSQEAGGLAVWLEELYILPQFQRQGLGSQAIRALEAYYPENRRVRLEVEPDNADAARLYRRLGFKPLAYRQYVKE